MTYSIEIRGIVQGVGFRPYIYNIATTMNLGGYVLNDGYGVIIVVQCEEDKLNEFIKQIKERKPPLSKIESIKFTQIKEQSFSDFVIKESENSNKPSLEIPVDVAMCEDCKSEMQDKNNRRFEYPFINCTNCGPRYSIIQNLPYDRKNTSMAKFDMCLKCQDEYNNQKNRRYHAEPIACYECGPKLSLLDASSEIVECENEIEKTVELLASGNIVAIKGIGGYHLVCDATNDEAIKLLRQRKQRPSKPFAVMTKDIQAAKNIATMNEKEEELLSSIKRPIVLVQAKKNSYVSDLIAPYINQIGLFLPYTPLHHLILEKFDRPIVATSANISGEPLCTTSKEIMRLSHIWDYCLDNDRDILNSCDDSVIFVENGSTSMLRNARGYAPSFLKLPKKSDKKILALGANQKSTVAIVVEDKVILSPYIGDLDGLGSLEHFKSHIDTLKRIYDFEPDVIVCDKHPNYESTKYAKELKSKDESIELIQVQHHYAHILATMGLNNVKSKVLGVSFDGTGYGDDKNLWGGEFFVCDTSSYERVGHFKEFRLLGADKAIKEPRRIALSFLFDIYGEDVFELKSNVTNSFAKEELKILYTVWKKGLNSPLSSSAGRLFDCVASLIDVIQVSSYEGESGLLLEALYDDGINEHYKFYIENGVIDFSKIVMQILDEKDKNIVVSKFFNTLVEIIFRMSKMHKLPVVLGGGVFQNRVLLRLIMNKIPDVVVARNFVSNDSSIAYGQVLAI